MEKKALCLEHNLLPPRTETGEKPVLLIQLHGIGSNKDDLFSFAGQLPKEYCIVSAQAPIPYFGGYAWYNLEVTPTGFYSNPKEAQDAIQKIDRFIDEAIEAYGTQEKVILMGFSQGAILSYATAFQSPEKVKGVVAMSGYYNNEFIPVENKLDRIRQIPIFSTHGTFDEVIPVDKTKQSYKAFEENGLNFEFHEYPMAHGVSPEALQDVMNWIGKAF